jgi:hypothetical protein
MVTELDGTVVTKLTAPKLPVVASWLAKPAEAVVVTVPDVGDAWLMAPVLTVRPNDQVPVMEGSLSVPETVYVPGASVVAALMAPPEVTVTSVESAEVVSV